MTTLHPVQANDFSSMDDDTLAAAVSTLAAHIHAATYRLLVLIAELDRREVWAAQGALSCAHWLSWACGIDTHTAREKVRVARALTGLPLLSESLAKGELGYSKVRALTRIATGDNEADLLNIGLHGTAQHVEKFVRLHRRAKRAEETERADAQHENRGLTFWHDDDGTVVLHGRFPPEMGARILSALDAAMAAHAAEQPATEWDDEGLAPEDVPRGTSGQDTSSADAATDAGARASVASHQREDAQVFLTDVPRGTFIRGPSRTVRRADALAWMAERLFESGDAPGLPPDRHEIVVHVEADVLADRRAGRCEIEHRTAIAAETARRLCCDAGIITVVDGANGEPLSVGRRTRSIPPSVRRALASRDRGCRFPGCTAITSSTGPTVARPRSTTLSCSARPITGSCTRAGSTCNASTTARSGSPTRTGWQYKICRPEVRTACRTDHPQLRTFHSVSCPLPPCVGRSLHTLHRPPALHIACRHLLPLRLRRGQRPPRRALWRISLALPPHRSRSVPRLQCRDSPSVLVPPGPICPRPAPRTRDHGLFRRPRLDVLVPCPP